MCLVCVSPLLADSWENTSWDNTKYNTTEGTEFYATFLKNAGSTEKDSANLRLYLHAAANETTNVKVIYMFDGYTQNFIVNKNSQTTIPIELSKAYVDFIQDASAENQISLKGLLVTSEKPISLYVTNSRSGAYGGTCILPINALGVDHIIQTYYGDDESTIFAVVGTQQNTKVTLNIKKTRLDGTLYQKKNTIEVDTITYENFDIQLQKGEVFLYRSTDQNIGLSGTRICSNKPIAVFNGHQAARIPFYDGTANHLNAQTYPLDKWGKQYIVTPTKGYTNKMEHVRLTAFYDDTQIKKNDVIVCNLKAFETYQDTIDGYAVYYESSKPVACFLYTLSKGAIENKVCNNEAARPSLSPITPIEYSTSSLLFATFTESDIVNEHYVNFVVEEKYVGGMRLDNSKITATYSDIYANGSKYKYTQLKITPTAHRLTNTNKQGAFTARVYGMGSDDYGISSEFYAYAAGSRVSRKIDILVDGQYILEKTICKGAPAIDFEGLIGFEIDGDDEVSWCIKEIGDVECDTIIYENIDGEYLMSHYFQTDSVDKDFEVSLIVTKNTPSICDDCNYITTVSDTVKVYIHLNTTYDIKLTDHYCYGTEFTVHKDSTTYNLIADTVNIYPPFTEVFKIDKPYTITNKLKSDYQCDSIIQQTFYIHVPDTALTEASICDNQLPYVWNLKSYTGKNDSIIIDTIRGEELTLTRSVEYQRYTCPCLAELKLHIYPSYLDSALLDTCEQQKGIVYQWADHAGHMVYDVQNQKKINADSIPIDQPGEYTYVDSLKIQCNDCPKCDSIGMLKVRVFPSYYSVQDTTISNEDYIEWNGWVIAGEDALIDKDSIDYTVNKDTILINVASTEHGCDNIDTLRIRYGKLFRDTTYATVCETELEYVWYWNGRALDTITPLPKQDTTYTHTTKSSIGVDSIFYLKLSILPTSLYLHSETWCRSAGPYSYDTLANFQGLIQSGIYRDTLYGANSNGCDSIIELTLTIIEGFSKDTVISMCDNEYVMWENRIYMGAKYDGELLDDMLPSIVLQDTTNYLDSITYTSSQGCDSTMKATFNVYPSYGIVRDTTIHYICDNQSYTFFDSIYNTNGEWRSSSQSVQYYILTDTTTTQHGCDSVVVHMVYVHPTYETIIYDTICQQIGGVYLWENHAHPIFSQELNEKIESISIDNIGEFTYVDSLKTTTCTECAQGGCDDIYTLHLNVIPSYDIVDTIVMISEEEVFIWHEDSIIYGGSTTNKPCDSIIPVQWPDTFVITREYETKPVGTYVCDSLRSLKIVIGKVYRDTTYGTVCSNETYQWYGTDKDGQEIVRMEILDPQDSIYMVSYKTSLGFDSIFYLDLTVLPAYEGVESMTTYVTTCQYSEYRWIRDTTPCSKNLFCTTTNKWVTIADTIPTNEFGIFTYVDSLKTQVGCDSVWTLHLTIDPIYVDTISFDMCENDYIIWEHSIYKGIKYMGVLPNDTMPVVTLSPQLNYYDDTTYITTTGCDSTISMQLNVYPIYSVVDTLTTCDKYNPYIWETHDAFGVYYDTVYFTPRSMYIDSITNLPKKDTILVADRYRTLHTIQGCDSLVRLHLTINPTYFFLTKDTVCSGDFYQWRGHEGYWNSSTVVADTFSTQAGCDSIYQLDLYVKPAHVTHCFEYICENHTLYFQDEVVWGPWLSKTDTLKDFVYKNEYDCDSIFRYHLTIMPTYDKDTVSTICSNEAFYLHDSLDFYVPIMYYDTNTYAPIIDTLISDTLFTKTCPKCPDGGCDSIYTANLRILPAYKHVDYDTICSNDTIYWHKKKCFNAVAGDYRYYDSLQTVLGCDSIYELQLNVKQAYHTVLTPDTICADDSIFFAGRYINKSGIYKDTLSTVDQCDSIFHLELVVLDTTAFVIHDTICVTEKYILDTLYSDYQIFTKPGFYIDTTQNDWGCRHTTYLHLEVVDTTAYTLSIGDICADEDEILIYYTYSGLPLIEYSVIFDTLGLMQGFSNIYHESLDTTQLMLRIPIPKGDILPRPNPTYFDSQQGVNVFVDEDKYAYPQPNQYHITVIMHNTICGDTLQRKDTIFNLLYPSWIHEQHWNDGIVLYNEKYNGGYEYSHYQWYQNGEPIVGQTKEYLYLPEQLLLNEKGDCNNYYQVLLTRESDGYSTFTCPICPVYQPQDTIVPCLDYFSIVPTLVVKENPVVHILSTMPGTCVGYDLAGVQLFDPFDFVPNQNNYAGQIEIPVHHSGVVYIRLSTQNGDSRVFKILIQ